jgi:hypothetical protein
MAKSWNISGAQINAFMGTVKENLNGMQVSGFGSFVEGDTNGFQASGFMNINNGATRGFQGAGFMNIAAGLTNGMQAAGFMNTAGNDSKLAQAAGFMNIAGDDSRAGQFAGFMNIAGKNFDGMQAAGFMNIVGIKTNIFQVAGFMNIAGGGINGFQLGGFMNVAKEKVNGLQLAGFMNIADELTGVQISPINIARSGTGVPLGILNIVLDGLHSPSVYADSASKNVYVQYQGGTNNFFSTMFAGTNADAFGEDIIYGIGFGTRVPIGEKLALDFEALARQTVNVAEFQSHFTSVVSNQNEIDTLSEYGYVISPEYATIFNITPEEAVDMFGIVVPMIRVTANLQLFKLLGVYVSYNAHINIDAYNNSAFVGTTMTSNNVWDDDVRVYHSISFGIRM